VAVFTSGPLQASFPHCLSQSSKSLSALTPLGSLHAQGSVSARTVTVAALTRRRKRLPQFMSYTQTLSFWKPLDVATHTLTYVARDLPSTEEL
jgi:hypothetical protein